MKKLKPRSEFDKVIKQEGFFNNHCSNITLGKEVCIQEIITNISHYDENLFYPLIGTSLESIGFEQCYVHRAGDTNMRFDAAIVESNQSIPIEIKSPAEIPYINTKSIRQALENKIILHSRNFYKAKEAHTSLAIGYKYPKERSGVYELIDDIKNSFGFNIGIIDIKTILELRWTVEIENKPIDLGPIYDLKGPLKL